MKRRWGMVIDLDKCTGCGNCAVACSQENNMPIFEDDSDVAKRVTFLDIMRVTNDRDAKYPNVKTAFVPKMCQQCEGNDPKNPEPPCVSVCLASATDVGDDGVVSQIWSRCVGCRYCQVACPYEARVFHWWKPKYEGSFKKSLNPDISIASRGTVVKCTFCSHIWKQERDRQVQKGNLDINAVTYKTACQVNCPTGAISFGDLNDEKSDLHKMIYKKKGVLNPRAVRIAHEIDDRKPADQAKLKKMKHFANPKVFYLTSQQWLKDMMRFPKAIAPVKKQEGNK